MQFVLCAAPFIVDSLHVFYGELARLQTNATSAHIPLVTQAPKNYETAIYTTRIECHVD